MKSTILSEYKTLILTFEPTAFPDVTDAISKTILGNPGGIRYRQLDALKKIQEIRPLHFFPLRRKGELILVMALVERITRHTGIPYYTYYVRYVTFNPSFAVKMPLNTPQSQALQRAGNSFMKEGIKKHSETFSFFLRDENADRNKKIYYAFVEETNLRSLNFTGFFFEKIRNFSVVTYSNLFPRADKRVSLISSDYFDQICGKIESLYNNHTLFFLEKEKLASHYFVIKEKDEIVAGVKAQTVNWKIEELPGIAGGIIKKILPFVPGISRLIRPDRFTFLTFDAIFCNEGCDLLLPVLFRSVCAKMQIYAAMIYLDSKDPLLERIQKLNNMGMLNRLYRNAKGAVIARFVNYADKEKQAFYENPVFISGYDLT